MLSSLALAAVAPGLGQAAVVSPVTSVQPALVDFVWTRVVCGGVEQVPTRAARPRVVAAHLVTSQALPPISLRFRISTDGRPLSISQPVRDPVAAHGPYIVVDDLPATLAGWQFAPGAERTGCEIVFMPRHTAIATAPLQLIQRYAGLPRTPWTGWNESMARLRQLERTCNTPRPLQPLLTAYPDWDTVSQPAGTMAHTVVGFDVDDGGKPVKLRTLQSDGNVVLDRKVLAAVARSRFTKGAREGCSVTFHRTADRTLAAPDSPSESSLRPSGATCPSEIVWDRKPTLSYPDEYRARRIEGWAIIGFDVAPWGALGNVRVLAAEPAAAFGEQGRRVLQNATLRSSASGGTGCVKRVVFRIAAMPGEASTPPVPVPSAD